jgi:glutamyl-tRNA synthetase
MRQTADADLLDEVERVLPHIAGGAELKARLTPEARAKLLAGMAGLKERAKTLIELVDGARFIVADRPIALDEKAKGLLTTEARQLLGDLSQDLGAIEPWRAETTEQAVRAFAERKGVKLGSIAQPLRAALTGRTCRIRCPRLPPTTARPRRSVGTLAAGRGDPYIISRRSSAARGPRCDILQRTLG